MRLPFDPSVRFGDDTFIPTNELPPGGELLTPGVVVIVYAEASRLETKGTVTAVDEDFVTVNVAWSDLQLVARDATEANTWFQRLVPSVAGGGFMIQRQPSTTSAVLPHVRKSAPVHIEPGATSNRVAVAN